MSEIPELKPCPLCNGPAEQKWIGSTTSHYIECNACGLRTAIHVAAHGGSAKDDWNRRALSSPSPSTEQGVVTDEMVETASKAYADHTEYYIQFHRGLSSPSANKIRAGMRKALEAALSTSHPPKESETPEGWVLVPEAALKWLFGEGPDQNGNWFERTAEDRGSFWWRKRFRAMIAAAPTKGGSDV